MMPNRVNPLARVSPAAAVVVASSVRVATAAVNTIELTIAKAKGGGQAATTGKPAKREQPLLYSGLVERFMKIGLALMAEDHIS